MSLLTEPVVPDGRLVVADYTRGAKTPKGNFQGLPRSRSCRPVSKLIERPGPGRDRQRQQEGEPQSQAKATDTFLEGSFQVRSILDPFQEVDSLGDASMPPGSRLRFQTVQHRDVRQSAGEDPDADGTDRLRRGLPFQTGALNIKMGGAAVPATGHGPAAEEIRLTLEATREVSKDDQKVGGQATQEENRLHDQTDLRGRPVDGGDPKDLLSEPACALTHEGHHSETSHEEKSEVGEMSVDDVADLVPEHRLDLPFLEARDQGVGQENISVPGQSSGDTGVHEGAVRFPDEDVRVPKTESPREAVQPIAERSGRKAPG